MTPAELDCLGWIHTEGIVLERGLSALEFADTRGSRGSDAHAQALRVVDDLLDRALLFWSQSTERYEDHRALVLSPLGVELLARGRG